MALARSAPLPRAVLVPMDALWKRLVARSERVDSRGTLLACCLDFCQRASGRGGTGSRDEDEANESNTRRPRARSRSRTTPGAAASGPMLEDAARAHSTVVVETMSFWVEARAAAESRASASPRASPRLRRA